MALWKKRKSGPSCWRPISQLIVQIEPHANVYMMVLLRPDTLVTSVTTMLITCIITKVKIGRFNPSSRRLIVLLELEHFQDFNTLTLLAQKRALYAIGNLIVEHLKWSYSKLSYTLFFLWSLLYFLRHCSKLIVKIIVYKIIIMIYNVECRLSLSSH